MISTILSWLSTVMKLSECKLFLLIFTVAIIIGSNLRRPANRSHIQAFFTLLSVWLPMLCAGAYKSRKKVPTYPCPYSQNSDLRKPYLSFITRPLESIPMNWIDSHQFFLLSVEFSSVNIWPTLSPFQFLFVSLLWGFVLESSTNSELNRNWFVSSSFSCSSIHRRAAFH